MSINLIPYGANFSPPQRPTKALTPAGSELAGSRAVEPVAPSRRKSAFPDPTSSPSSLAPQGREWLLHQGQAQAYAAPQVPPRAGRALAAYQTVQQSDERDQIGQLLGVSEYA